MSNNIPYLGDYHKSKEPHFEARLARKDAAFEVNLAQTVGTRMPSVVMADSKLVEVQKHAVGAGIAVGLIHMYGIG